MKKHFVNLDGLRFVLAMFVLVAHAVVLGYKNAGRGDAILEISPLHISANAALFYFFTLSGFLITYILLSELKKEETINKKNYYLKRILRIWPLYFFTLILHWFVAPQFEFNRLLENMPTANLGNFVIFDHNISCLGGFLCYLFFLPQLATTFALASNGTLFPAFHFWSIGVEEIFYLFIPVFLVWSRKIFRNLSLLTVSYYLLPAVLYFLHRYSAFHRLPVEKVFAFLFLFVFVNKFGCILMGVLTAWLYVHHKEKLLKWCTWKTAILAFLITAIMIFKEIYLYIFIPEVYSFLFCFILVYLSENKLLLLENKVIAYLGRISYGIYLYHNLCIALVWYALSRMQMNSAVLASQVIACTLATLLTILVSAASFELFEKYFLTLKPGYPRKGKNP